MCGLLILYGCGGGSGPATDVDELVSDPRYVRAQEIAEVATWLTVPASYTELTLSVQGQSQRTTLPWYGYCFRLECTMTGYGAAAGLSTTADVEDFLVPLRGAELKRLELGERAGMTTGVLAGDIDFTLGSGLRRPYDDRLRRLGQARVRRKRAGGRARLRDGEAGIR